MTKASENKLLYKRVIFAATVLTVLVLAIGVWFGIASPNATKKEGKYEVWAPDQSNSVPGQSALGMKGSFLWIYDSVGIERQLRGLGEAVPISCAPGMASGPCDAFGIFPPDLAEIGADGFTGKQLDDLPGFGRLHGVEVDPQNKYVNANFFTPGGAFLGIIDVETKEAVALFRLSEFSTAKKRSVHMSFWTLDGSTIVCSNLHGKAVERINIGRDSDGAITSVGTNNEVTEEATLLLGNNAFGRPLMGSIIGDYSKADLGDLTPNGYCKEDSCETSNLPDAGRANNVPICPITSTGGYVYTNFGGGGLFVLDSKTTPMSIVGEYHSETFNGAGCGGVQVGQQVFMNAGVSASASGLSQSTFSLYSFNNEAYSNGPNTANDPPPIVVFKDPTNTNTIGNVDGRTIHL